MRAIIRLAIAMVPLLVMPNALAQQQREYNTTPRGAMPQGFEQVRGVVPAPNAERTQAVPPGMLPVGVQDATRAGATDAPGPFNSNLGGVTTTGPYTLGRDDVVSIVVRGQPDFTGEFVVGHNGAIQYSFIGDVQAEGLTKEELQAVLTEKLKRFVRVPDVFVSISGFNSKAVYIVGEVAAPGKYAMRGDAVLVRDALMAAGLVAERAALSRVKVVRYNDGGEPIEEKINMDDVLYDGELEDNVELTNKDIVYVPTKWWTKVTGAISSVVNPTVGTASTVRGF